MRQILPPKLTMTWLLLAFVSLGFAWLVPPCHGQGLRPEKITVVGESPFLQKRLDSARQLVASGKQRQAWNSYRTLLAEIGDNLVPVRRPQERIYSTTRSVSARHLIHQTLAALQKEQLQDYQATVEVLARKALEQGTATHSRSVLREAVRDFYAHPATAQALRLLGDLAFEKGDFGAAKQWWALLGPMDESVPSRLIHPARQLDLGEVQARWVLATLFQGNQYRADKKIRSLKKLHPRVTLRLGGKQVNALDALENWMKRDLSGVIERNSWTSVGGNLAHAYHIPSFPASSLWVRGEAWRVKLSQKQEKLNNKRNQPVLDRRKVGGKIAFGSKLTESKLPRSYPILHNGSVIVSTDSSVLAYDILDGKQRFAFRVPAELLGLPRDVRSRNGPVPRFVPAVEEERLFCVLGHRNFSDSDDNDGTKTKSLLVCLDFQKGKNAGKLLWKQHAEGSPKEQAVFSSDPIVFNERAYVIREQLTGFRWESWLVCYSVTSGEKLWDLPVLRSLQWAEPRRKIVRQPSLTLAGTVLVYCSNQGAIIGFDPTRGTRLWAVGYPSHDEQRLPLSSIGPSLLLKTKEEPKVSVREFCPCIFADSRLFVAPTDTDRIYSLNPLTGRTLWERDRIQVVHLLGCHNGRLVFNTDNLVRAVDSESGSDKGGWIPPTSGAIRTTGRGFLAGDAVLWPTGDPNWPVKLIDCRSGQPILGKIAGGTALRRLQSGNFAYTKGCLVVATCDEIIGYIATERKPTFHE
ncbi:MAG: PQQ-binding-like beta-propeller repeat protein [Gemmataceae bacterium]